MIDVNLLPVVIWDSQLGCHMSFSLCTLDRSRNALRFSIGSSLRTQHVSRRTIPGEWGRGANVSCVDCCAQLVSKPRILPCMTYTTKISPGTSPSSIKCQKVWRIPLPCDYTRELIRICDDMLMDIRSKKWRRDVHETRQKLCSDQCYCVLSLADECICDRIKLRGIIGLTFVVRCAKTRATLWARTSCWSVVVSGYEWSIFHERSWSLT